MTAYDIFTKGSDRYAVVSRLAADPLPLGPLEVAEYQRPLWPRIRRAAFELAALVLIFGAAAFIYAAVHG